MIIQVNYADSLPILQKRLIRARLAIIKYIRLGVWVFPLNFGFIILFFHFLFGVDIVAVGDRTWIIGNIIFNTIVFVPLAIWAHLKLSPKNADKKWMNRQFRGNGSQITDAIKFLDEIEDFEKSDNN